MSRVVGWPTKLDNPVNCLVGRCVLSEHSETRQMSKKFKNKTCVYCGAENSSETADHVFARELFHLNKRNNLPKVPACKKCNKEKSSLELYLTSVLPFGGRHADASTALNMVEHRLAKNVKLHRQLASCLRKKWVEENGILRPVMILPFDPAQLDGLFRFIIKGLLWHHWKVLLTTGHFVGAGSLANEGEKFFWGLFNKNANNRVSESLGGGTIQYEGVQGFGCPELSLWKFTIYGGVKLSGDPDLPTEHPSLVWGLTCRKGLQPPFWD